jgi:hypothetical protein
VVGEHSEFVAEHTTRNCESATFCIIDNAFCVNFAQEVKAEVGFSPGEIGVFGQTGVFKFSLSFLSAKGNPQLAE